MGCADGKDIVQNCLRFFTHDSFSLPLLSNSRLAEPLIDAEDEEVHVAQNRVNLDNHDRATNDEELRNDSVEPMVVDEEGQDSGLLSRCLAFLRYVFLPEPEPNDEALNLPESQEERDSCVDKLLDPLTSCVNRCLGLENREFSKSCIVLVACVVGLQTSFVVWGYMLELIMNKNFEPTESNPNGRLPSVTVCVLANRFAAVLVSAAAVFFRHGFAGKQFGVPLRVFSVCAITSWISSWCVYASLRHISFPVMTVSRSCKVVVVMLVGRLLHGTKYSWKDHACGVLITIGAIIYSWGFGRSFPEGNQPVGYILIVFYLFSDAFTAQWQELLYQKYGRRNIDSFQMMLGVNVFGLAFASISLLLSGDTHVTLQFLKKNPVAIEYLAFAAISSCLGQLFIFVTIREFGPVLYSIVMTVRQIFSVILSSVMFGHRILSPHAIIGGLLVFVTVGFQISQNYFLARQPETLIA